MAGLIMMGLIALMVIGTILTFFMSKGWKKALYTFVTFLVIIGVFHLYVDHTCGPNAKDVEIMTPQAEAISNYILKNGIPESLSQVPNLPYKLERCSKQTKIDETCSYKNNNRLYTINFYRFMPGSYTLRIDTPHKNGITRVAAHFKEQSNGAWVLENLDAHLAFGKGLCNPMRQ